MKYFTQVHCSLLFHGYGLHYNTTKKLYFVILSRRKIRDISLRFIVHIILHGYGLTRSKRVNTLYFVLLSRRKTSFYVKFRFIVHVVYLFLHGCGLHYNVLSGLSGNKRVNDKLHNYAQPTKKTGLLANIQMVLQLVSFASL